MYDSFDEFNREVEGDGPLDSEVLILTDRPHYDDIPSGRLFQDPQAKKLIRLLQQHGIPRTRIRCESILQFVPPGRNYYTVPEAERTSWRTDCIKRLSQCTPNVVVALGDEALNLLTNKRGIDKWQLSILEVGIGIFPTESPTKVVPLFHPDRVNRQPAVWPFFAFGAQRVAEESRSKILTRVERQFTIQPSRDEVSTRLNTYRGASELGLDIETSRGKIFCLGIAPTPTEAISIPTLRCDYNSDKEYFQVWKEITSLLETQIPKVLQNGIYDCSYLSRYGIRVGGLFAEGSLDTMVAQKTLFPELPMGLDTIARIHTKEPYWKEEGKNWADRKDIESYYIYNCKDAAVMLEAAISLRAGLKKRGLWEYYQEAIKRNMIVAMEATFRQLPFDHQYHQKLKTKAIADLEQHHVRFQALAQNVQKREKPYNNMSVPDKKHLIKKMGFRIPVKRGKETTDALGLKKLRLKDADNPLVNCLLILSEKEKELSSYLNIELDPMTGRLPFTLYAHGTESARMSSGKDSWNRGLNAQTIPSYLRGMISVSKGHLIEVDLKQAEARVLAWYGPVPRMQKMFNEGIDIHRFMASRPGLFGGRPEDITYDQRQLGKKVIHAGDYDTREYTLSDMCLLESNLVLPIHRSKQMLNAMHAEFPGVRQNYHRKIKEQVLSKRMLRTPLGAERYFYGRPSDSQFLKEAYSYVPQNVVTLVIDFLLHHVFGFCHILLQTHDGCLLWVPDDRRLKELLDRILDQDAWNPTMPMAGGDLRIPIEVLFGKSWTKEMEEVRVA